MMGLVRAEFLLLMRFHGALAMACVAVLIAGGLPFLLQPARSSDLVVPIAVLTQASIRTAQLALITATALVGGTHFRDGHLSTAVLAVPRRMSLLAAQGIAAALWAIPAATITSTIAVVVAHTLGTPAMPVPEDPAGLPSIEPVVSAVLMTTAYLLLMMLFAWGLTLLLRRAWVSAAVICALCSLVPVLSMMIPAIGVLPGGAGVALLSHHPVEIPGGHPWWLVMWAVVGVAAGSVAMIRRDVDGG